MQPNLNLRRLNMGDDLKFLKKTTSIFDNGILPKFLKIKDELNFFENGRRP